MEQLRPVEQSRRQTLVLALGLCLAIAATFFFGYRAGRTARHAQWQNEPVRSWMSVPFVAHTRHVRSDLLFEAIHVPPNPRDYRPIRDIARAEKVPADELIRELQKAIADVGPETATQPGGRAPR